MDSREDNKAPSVPNEESNHDANYIPGFNDNLPSSTGPESSISNSRSESPSLTDSCDSHTAISWISNSRSESPSLTDSCDPHTVFSWISNSRSESPSLTGSCDPHTAVPWISNSRSESPSLWDGSSSTLSNSHQSQSLNSTENYSSPLPVAKITKWQKIKLQFLLERRSELNYLTSKLDDCQDNLKEVGSIGGFNQNSLLPLVKGIRHLCNYRPNLSSGRRQLKSKIPHQNFILRNNYPVLCKRGIWHQLKHLKKLLSTEISLSLQFIRDYKIRLDVEEEECTVNLLKEVARYTDKLSAFERRIFQRNGLVHGQGDHIQQLERLLSEITSSLVRCVEMFFVMSNYGTLGYRRSLRAGTGQYRNMLIG